MNIMKKLKNAAVAATLAVASASAMASDNTILDAITTEMGGLKTAVGAIGVIAVGIGIAFATIRIGKRGANSVG
mgnify:CR=1 FL=1